MPVLEGIYDIGNMLAVVVEAMQEMWVVVNGNQERIDSLEERIALLEAELGVERATSSSDEDVQSNEVDTVDDGVEPTTQTGSNSSGKHQQTGLAISKDSGNSWIKYSSKPVLSTDRLSWDSKVAATPWVLKWKNEFWRYARKSSKKY